MRWFQKATLMPQTIEECDERMRENFEGATFTQNGVIVVSKGKVVDEEIWRERVKRVFERRDYYRKRCAVDMLKEERT